MSALIVIERHKDKRTGHFFRAVCVNGNQKAAFWHLSQALPYAERLARETGAQLLSADVIPLAIGGRRT